MKKNSNNKTTTLEALVAVSKSETGMDYVQVMPTNPRVGLTEPFHGMGYGQMLSNGTFDFVRRIRQRRKPTLKLAHTSLSLGCNDGYDRLVFLLPTEQRDEFCKLLKRDTSLVVKFIIKMLGQ